MCLQLLYVPHIDCLKGSKPIVFRRAIRMKQDSKNSVIKGFRQIKDYSDRLVTVAAYLPFPPSQALTDAELQHLPAAWVASCHTHLHSS